MGFFFTIRILLFILNSSVLIFFFLVKFCIISLISLFLFFLSFLSFFFFVFFFLAEPLTCGSSLASGSEPAPQQQPQPSRWQQMLHPLCHKGPPAPAFFSPEMCGCSSFSVFLFLKLMQMALITSPYGSNRIDVAREKRKCYPVK